LYETTYYLTARCAQGGGRRRGYRALEGIFLHLSKFFPHKLLCIFSSFGDKKGVLDTGIVPAGINKHRHHYKRGVSMIHRRSARSQERVIQKGRVISNVYLWILLFVKLPSKPAYEKRPTTYVRRLFLPRAETPLQTSFSVEESIPRSKGWVGGWVCSSATFSI